MTYLSGKAEEKRKRVRNILYVGFFAALIIFWSIFKATLYPIIEPVIESYAETKENISSIPDFFTTYVTSRSNLTAKNKSLEKNIESLENQIAEKDAKLKELSIIDGDLDRDGSSSFIVMYPLMQDISRLYSTILFSKGYKDGVEKDEYVFVRGLQPICVIKEVYTSTSLCELLSSGGVITEATIYTSSSTSVNINLNGRGGGAFLGDVARDTPIYVGDKVFLKSDQSMVIGTIVEILHNNQDTAWRVFVRGAYNPTTSSLFYIRKKNK